MFTPIRQAFIVDLPPEDAWQHLARVTQWPSWAKHIKHVELVPAGELTSGSRGIIHLNNGLKSTFLMTEFDLHRNWKWVGPFLWLTIHYDHRFEPIGDHHTKLVWNVGVTGFGASIFGRLFAAIYRKNLKRAIPNLVAEMNAQSKAPFGKVK